MTHKISTLARRFFRNFVSKNGAHSVRADWFFLFGHSGAWLAYLLGCESVENLRQPRLYIVDSKNVQRRLSAAGHHSVCVPLASKNGGAKPQKKKKTCAALFKLIIPLLSEQKPRNLVMNSEFIKWIEAPDIPYEFFEGKLKKANYFIERLCKMVADDSGNYPQVAFMVEDVGARLKGISLMARKMRKKKLPRATVWHYG